jgi:hypothetical protein
MNKRLIIFISSVIAAAVVVPALTYIDWTPSLAYFAYFVLAIIFLGILVSNQRFEEDTFSKIERYASAFLLSYIVFFRLLYAPLSQFFFGTLVKNVSFFSDLLSMVLFAIFFFLFGTAFLVLNKYSSVGFLPGMRIFNNERTFVVLRGLFISAVIVFILFYARNSFFSINNSASLNAVLPAATCNWTYIEYPNFLSMGRTVSGRNVCLYNLSQDRYNGQICDRINDPDTKELCEQYFVPNYQK